MKQELFFPFFPKYIFQYFPVTLFFMVSFFTEYISNNIFMFPHDFSGTFSKIYFPICSSIVPYFFHFNVFSRVIFPTRVVQSVFSLNHLSHYLMCSDFLVRSLSQENCYFFFNCKLFFMFSRFFSFFQIFAVFSSGNIFSGRKKT